MSPPIQDPEDLEIRIATVCLTESTAPLPPVQPNGIRKASAGKVMFAPKSERELTASFGKETSWT